jgi:hypothetical protein
MPRKLGESNVEQIKIAPGAMYKKSQGKNRLLEDTSTMSEKHSVKATAIHVVCNFSLTVKVVNLENPVRDILRISWKRVVPIKTRGFPNKAMIQVAVITPKAKRRKHSSADGDT